MIDTVQKSAAGATYIQCRCNTKRCSQLLNSYNKNGSAASGGIMDIGYTPIGTGINVVATSRWICILVLQLLQDQSSFSSSTLLVATGGADLDEAVSTIINAVEYGLSYYKRYRCKRTVKSYAVDCVLLHFAGTNNCYSLHTLQADTI